MQRNHAIVRVGFTVAASSLLALSARAQTPCFESIGPDLVISDITTPANYASDNGVEAFFLGWKVANVGTVWADYQHNTSAHPVFGQGLYRIKVVDGSSRIEQVGQSWIRHAFFALSSSAVCTCTPTDGAHLGVGCMDTLVGSAGGSGQSVLGPRWQVDADSGVFPFPAANPPMQQANARRLLVNESDLETADGVLPTHYLVEVHCAARDEALAGYKNNNASSREVLVSGAAGAWSFALAGTTQREKPAVIAWRDFDPTVSTAFVDVPGEGRFILAHSVTHVGVAVWRYEYALYNMNSDLSAGSFIVPYGVGSAPRSFGFHDVDYHDGDGPGVVDFDGTAWAAALKGDNLEWATTAYAENPSANALRWGTTYNFRFEASTPPIPGTITIGMFKPGGPSSVTVTASVPSDDGSAGTQERGRKRQ